MNHEPHTAEEVSDSLLQAEQVRLLSNSIPTAAPGNMLGATAIVWMLWDVVPTVALLAWGCLLVATQLSRLALFAAVRRTPNSRSPRRWRTLLRLGVMFGGLAWGVLPIFLFPPGLPHQAVLALVVIGITSAVLVGLASDRVSVLLFSLSAVLPLFARLLLEGGEIRTAVAALTVLYLAYLAAAAARGERAFRDTLALRERADRHSAALIVARDEAERANRAKSEFLSNMSHELRTPMNAILGFGQLVEMDDKLSAEHRDYVREILRAGNHLLELINEVLDLARIESGRIDLSLEPVEVGPVIDECLSLVRALADRRDVRIVHAGLQGMAVRADRTRLKQALLNLLSNAIKYNRQGGSMGLEAQPARTGRVCLRVTDNGPGIAAERLAELFQPFNRLGAEKSGIEGTGIGLTITRRIVEMMGGTLEVESKIGVGSTFRIELPLESPPRPAQEATTAADTAPALPTDSARHTLLYIEDNPANLKLVARILGQRQHIHLLTAHTAELGIELARTRQPELILLDINLPGMDGYQVLHALKAEASLKDTPVIAVTANAMPIDIERGMAAGFSEYLSKPINVDGFFSLLDHYLKEQAPA